MSLNLFKACLELRCKIKCCSGPRLLFIDKIKIFCWKIIKNQVHLFCWIKQMQLVQNTKHQLTFGFDFHSFLLLEFCPKYVIESS